MLSTVLAFLVTIGVLVIIHEYGHYRAALACDVKVLRFSVGFGRVLWSRMRGETEFVVSMLPLGGYVKMLDEREGPVDERERDRAFNLKPLPQRAFIVAAGPCANLLLAVLLYAGVNWAGVEELRPWLGQPRVASLAEQSGLRAGDEVVAVAHLGNQNASSTDRQWEAIRSISDLQWHFTQATLNGEELDLDVVAGRSDLGSDGVVSAGAPHRILRLKTNAIPASDVDPHLLDRLGLNGPYAEPLIAMVPPDGPAASAGLKAGDRILQINGVTPVDASQLRQLIRQNHVNGQPRPITLLVERGSERFTVNLLPVVKTIQGEQMARIEAGIGAPPAMVTVRYGLVEGLTRAVRKTWEVSAMSLDMLGKMVLGQASLKNLSGPLTIADYAGRSADLGWVHYLGFLALVSVSLGVLNLLPLPVLDGGHLMYYLFEGLTGRPISPMWLERLQRGGVAIMLMMMSLAIYNDLARLLASH